MPDHSPLTEAQYVARPWPKEGLTRVPFWLFQEPEVLSREQNSLFHGPCWQFLCVEADLPNPGNFRSTFLGKTPVIVVRDKDGTLHGFENRCAHRGALLALQDSGTVDQFSCVYHAWTYDLCGKLKSVAFKNGIKGKGGMPKTFQMDDHGPRQLRIATLAGLVFGTMDQQGPPLEAYLGPEIIARINRVLGGRKLVVLGRFTQALPNNWKLYIENVKDSYHASILHLFFTTFRLNQLNMKGGIIVDPSGGHHVSYSAIDHATQAAAAGSDYSGMRSESSYRLADPSLLRGFAEFDDDITLQILTVFPNFVLQQIQNAIALRQVLPRNVDRTDLNWIYLGFESDSEEQRLIRLKQANLMGPAGFISMEDGCVGGFVQRGIVGASGDSAILEMGGTEAHSQESRITEASIRGFWKAYRKLMGFN